MGVNALLTDGQPAAPEQPPAKAPVGVNGAAPAQGTDSPPPVMGPVCSNCGHAMAPEQDWCLNCGAAAAGSGGGAGWRTALGIAAITIALVLGAAAAGVAALSKKTPATPVLTTTVAQAPPVTTPTTGTTTPTTPTTGVTPPPKIPLKAVIPPAAVTPTTTSIPATTTPAETNAKEQASKTGGSGSKKKEPEPILLDTNAAQTYNPYGYPAAEFGDPSLAIDGDKSTGWTAQINPANAPLLAEGVLIDLKTAQKLSAVKLITTTPGMVVQIYGANGHTVPSSITDKAWVPLSHSLAVKKAHSRIGLKNKKKAYRFVTLWISRAPASAVGTPEAPGRVTVNELELLPAE